MSDVGQRIKLLRQDKEWTQEDLASKVDVTRFSVANWELGRRIPSLETLKKLSEIFGVGVDYLVGRSPHEKISDLLPRVHSIFNDPSISDADKRLAIDRITSIYLLATYNQVPILNIDDIQESLQEKD